MRTAHLCCMVVVGGWLLAVTLGCRQESQLPRPPVVVEKPAAPRPENPAPKQPVTVSKPTEPTPPPVEPTPPPTIPNVTLDEANAATCLVKVDDLMPEGQLPNLDGQIQSIASVRGKTLTVVYFWKSDNRYGLEGLQELAKEVAQPYANKGVRLIAVNEGDSLNLVRQKVEQTGANVTYLHDTDGAYFRSVATQKLPRVYLLDAHGKILWFDVEYSRSVRRDLEQAIRAVLGET